MDEMMASVMLRYVCSYAATRRDRHEWTYIDAGGCPPPPLWCGGGEGEKPRSIIESLKNIN